MGYKVRTKEVTLMGVKSDLDEEIPICQLRVPFFFLGTLTTTIWQLSQ